MKKLHRNLIAAAVTLVFSAGAMAQGLSKPQYQAGKDKIAADYKVAKAACAAFTGNPGDVCVAEARGHKKVAKAELEASYRPTEKNRYKVSVAKAEAAYSVARERCDGMTGNAKDVCIKEAQAAEVAAKADAKVQRKTSEANVTANQATTEVRKDAVVQKMDAQYQVEKEKCDAYAGVVKAQCLDKVKARFGTP